MKYSAVPSRMLLVGIPILFSSFTLYLIDSWIKYPLFIFEVVAIITIYWVLGNQDIGNNLRIVNRILPREKSRDLILDLILIASASILVVLNGFHTTVGGIFQLVLAFICTSFLSGHALLHIFRVTNYFSKLEIVLFSYLASFIFSGFISLLLLPIDENMRTFIMPICFLVLGIISILRRPESKTLVEGQSVIIKRTYSFSNNIDVLAIVLCVAFYAIFFVFVYPNAVLLPGSDISRHYNYASILSRSPDLYDSAMSRYVLFHAFEAAFLVMSGIQQSVTQIHILLVVLNVFLPISLYILAKRFLSDIDKRIPAISVIFYTIMSNFSFIYYTQLKILGSANSQIHYLVADRSQNGNINFLQPFHFFVPLSVSIILFVIAFFLLKEIKLPRAKFVLLFSTVILSMYLTHVAEAVVFTIFLGLYSFVSRSKSLRIDDALLSSLIGLMAAALFVATEYIWTADQTYSSDFLNILSLFFPSLVVGSALIWRRTLLLKVPASLTKKILSRPIFYQSLSVILTLIYLLGFLSWFLIEDLNTSSLYELGTVPWLIYPVLLGIVGLLAVLSISYIRNIIPPSSVLILLSSIGFLFLLGRLISFVSLNVIILDYWEKRILGLILIFLCLLAPLSLIGIRDRIQFIPKNKKNLSLLKNICMLTLISIIVLSGFSSMAVQTDYWFSRSNIAKISERELEAVNFLKGVFQHDVHAYVIAPSNASKNVLAFAAPPYQFWRSELLVTSSYPDLPLVALDAYNLTHAYLYLHNRDLDLMKKEPAGWLKHHLLPILPVIFSNKEVTIYNATSVSFPVSNSNTTLIIPSEPHDDSWLYAYDIVSESGANYTVMYDKDPNSMSKKVILSFDPGAPVYENFSSGSSNKWEKIKGNWDFSPRGLVVEDNSDSLHNVILSPSTFTATNLSISTSFKIVKTDPKNTGYISIVYSWLDPGNYESAGITLSSEGIYVNFAKVTNGKLSFQPSWPGLKTNLGWNPNNVFNMTMHLKEDSRSITLNGTDSVLGKVGVTLQIPNEGNKKGHLGLSYARGRNIIFDDFRIDAIHSSPIDNYIRYAKEGGELVVLNTNGYGEIASFLFNMTKLRTPQDKDNMQILLNNEVIKNDVLNTGYLGYEGLQKGSTKQIMPASILQEINIGRGKISYINIYPILSWFFANRSSGSDTYHALREISKVINLAPTSSVFNFDEISAIFRNFTGNANNIEVDTKSVIFPTETHLSNLKVRTGQSSIDVRNITQLSISDYQHVLLWSNGNNSKISMIRGKGLYTDIILSNEIDQQSINNSSHLQSFSISMINNGTLTVSSYSSPQKTHLFHNVSNIYFTSDKPLEVTVRQPTVRITDGEITLNDTYAESDELYRKIGGSAVDLKVIGNMNMSIVIADTFALGKLNWDGILERVPALAHYNDLEAFVPNLTLAKFYSIPPLILLFSLIPFSIGIVFLICYPRKTLESN